MRSKAIVLCAVFLMSIPTFVPSETGFEYFDNEIPTPFSNPPEFGNYGVYPDIGWNETSFSFWLNFSSDEEPVNVNVSAVVNDIPYDMFENNTKDDDYSDGKDWYWMNEERLWSKGDIPFYFYVEINGTSNWTSTDTFEILNRKPYILSPPPTKIYANETVTYQIRVQDDDLDPIDGELVDHNFTQDDWVWYKWWDSNLTFMGVPAYPWVRWLNITIWDSYDQKAWYRWTITCVEREGGSSPPGGGQVPKQGGGLPFPSGAGDPLPTPTGEDPGPKPLTNSFLDLNPNTDGHELDWTPKGGGDHYVEVDDGNGTEDDDTTYVSTTKGNQEDYWDLEDTSQTGTINNIRLSLRVKHDTGGEEFAFALANATDVEWTSTDVADDTTWTTYTYDLATNPIEGGSWTWTQINALQLGIKSRAVGKFDGTQYCTAGWITVTYSADNNPPTISNKISTDEGGHNISYSRSFSATDPDGDTMTWSLVDNTTSSFLGIEYKSDGTQAWINGTPAWEDREQSFYVNATVDDGNGGTDWCNYTLYINNTAPVISNKITYDESPPNSAYYYDFDATDANSDTLSWTLETNASFLSIDPATGNVSGTTSYVNASYYVNAIVSDTMDTDNCNYTLYVNNTTPTITDKIATDEGTHNVSYSRQFNSSDTDEDTHTWAIEWSNASFLTVDSKNRTAWFNGTPTFSDTNQWFYVNITVNDSYAEDYCNYTLYVNNSAPSISNKITEDTGSVGVYYERDFNATDENSDTLTWSLNSNASFLTIGPSNGTVYGTPDATGEYYVNASVSDSMDTDTCNYTLTIYQTTDFYWTGAGDGYRWDDASNWWNSLAYTEYPNGNDDRAFFNESSSSLYAIDGANTITTVGEISVTSGFTGTINLSVNLVLDDAGGHSGDFNLEVGTFDVNGTSAQQINADGDVTILSAVTFYERTGVFIVQGATTQILRVQSANALYQLTTDTSGTVAELYDNLTVAKINIGAGTTYRMDAATRGYDLWTNFSDVAGCGFVSTSSGTLETTGDGTNDPTITSENQPPTNRWDNAWYLPSLSITADYTTFSYMFRFGGGLSGATYDIENCTFSDSEGWAFFITGGTTVIAFNNNTFTDNFKSLAVYQSISGLNNIVISASTVFDVEVATYDIVEFTKSNFDTSKVNIWSSGERAVISDNHNDVANAFKIVSTSTPLMKSSIQNDYSSSDNIELVEGEFTIDEASASNDFTIDSGSTLVLNTATTHTFDTDANLTNNGVLKSDGTITTSSGYFDFYTPGNAYLNNTTISNMDFNYYYGGFNFTVGRTANSTIADLTLEAPDVVGGDTAFNITDDRWDRKDSGVVWHMNVTASSGSVYFGTSNLTASQTYRSYVDDVQYSEGTADSGGWYNFSYSDWSSTKHFNLTWIVSNIAPVITNCINSDESIINTYYERDFDATDDDGDPLTWSMVTDEASIVIGSINGTVYGITLDENTYYVNVSVSDSTDTDTCNYTLYVNLTEKGQWDRWVIGFSYSKNWFSNEVRFTAIFNRSHGYNASLYIWDFGDGTMVETMNPNITHIFKWQLDSTETIHLSVVDTMGMKYSTEREIRLDNTLWVALLILGLIAFGAVVIVNTRKERKRSELMMVDEEGR